MTVTVVLTTCNRARFLQRAVQSVLAQTWTDFELIIVDNASRDETPRIVKGFADPRIRYVRHAVNLGGPAARNTGIKQARGRYVAFLDDDDQWLPSKLEAQVRKMEDAPPEVGLIYTGTEVIDEQTGALYRRYVPVFRGDVYQRLLMGTILGSVSSVLVRRACFDRVGFFDEELKSCQDWDMWLRLAEHVQFDYVPEVLTRISWHGKQISTDLRSLIPGRTRMVRKHRQRFQRYPEIYVIHLKRLGKLHCLNGTWAEAVGWFGMAIRVRPVEVIKIFGWAVWELPRLKLCSQEKTFRKMRPDED